MYFIMDGETLQAFAFFDYGLSGMVLLKTGCRQKATALLKETTRMERSERADIQSIAGK